MDLELSGKCFLVTGGASGIGAATAAQIVREGGSVALCGRRGQTLREFEAKFTPCPTGSASASSRSTSWIPIASTSARHSSNASSDGWTGWSPRPAPA